jgi:hypothetical protein
MNWNSPPIRERLETSLDREIWNQENLSQAREWVLKTEYCLYLAISQRSQIGLHIKIACE